MATERIQIIVTSKGTVTVRKEIEDIGKTSDKTAKGVDMLKGALATLVSGALISQISSLADAGTQLTNALVVAGRSGQGLVQTQNELFDIAKANGQNVNELAAIYQRLTTVQGQLGIGQEEIIEALKNIGAGFKVSASSAQAQSGALQQLQQLLGGTVVQMQEVNSLVDGAFPILQAVARGTDEFGGNVGALINRLREGGYSVKAFFDGLMRGSDINRQLAEDWNLSIGQALTNFRTNLIQGLLAFNQFTGAFTLAAQVIDFFGNNLLLLLGILSPVIAGISVLAVQWIGGALIASLTSAAAAVGTLVTAMRGLLLLVVANPFTALVAGLALVILYFVDWQQAIQNVISTFGKLMAIIGDFLGNKAMTAKGIEISLNADQLAKTLTEKAAEIKQAIVDGGDSAAKAMQNGVATGGKQAANAIKGAAAAGVQSAAASAQATYEALNGVPQKIKGAIEAGGDYMKNEVTGEITKSANHMKTGITKGGEEAAHGIGEAIKSGAQAGGRILYENIEQAFANNVRWLNDLYKIMTMRENADARLKNSEADKNQAEADKLRAEADNLRKRFGQGGGSGGGGTSGSGNAGSGTWTNGNAPGLGAGSYNATNPFSRMRREAYEDFLGLGSSETTTTDKVSITNVFDPDMLIEVQSSSKGQKALVNNIKANRDEIRLYLGIV